MGGVVRDDFRDTAGGPLITGSETVFVNNHKVVRVGDRVLGHGGGRHRRPVMARGSRDVFANGIQVCRERDPATCGHVATGSNDVFANGP